MSNQTAERFIYDSYERVFDRERNTWVDGAAAVDMLNDLHTAARVYREFMEWLTDQQVVHWTLTEETADDPIKAVSALLQTQLQEFEDPAISKTAAAARVGKEALERIADREGMPWPEYRKKWGLIPWWDGTTDNQSASQIAKAALDAMSPTTGGKTDESTRSL